LQDLWGQLWFLDRGERLGRSFEAFKSRWFQSIQMGSDRHAVRLEPLPFAQQQIEDRLRDLCLSLHARDYFDISEPIVNIVRVELPAKARRLYRAMEREAFLALDCGAEIEAFNAASKTIKCLQLANGAIYTDDRATAWAAVHDVKLQALESIVAEAAGMPVLVAYHFKSDLARLQRAFPQGRALDHNPQTIRDWNAGKIPLLFAHPASAGHGLNLQDGGNILAFFGHWWDPHCRHRHDGRIGHGTARIKARGAGPVTRSDEKEQNVTTQTNALDHQEGGGHYKDMPIQPVEFIHRNGIGYFEGNVIKYVSRWRKNCCGSKATG